MLEAKDAELARLLDANAALRNQLQVLQAAHKVQLLQCPLLPKDACCACWWKASVSVFACHGNIGFSKYYAGQVGLCAML